MVRSVFHPPLQEVVLVSQNPPVNVGPQLGNQKLVWVIVHLIEKVDLLGECSVLSQIHQLDKAIPLPWLVVQGRLFHGI